VEVGDWLRGLGLEQYEQAFRDNDIDARVLPGLTADDLREIGVVSVGHRRLMLQAIAALSAAAAPVAPATGMAEAVAASAAHAPPQAERRQLTVMFVDLVGSTALSSRLDLEELGEVLRAYQDAAAGAIMRFEGHVAQYLGDGVLAYFGYPRAHEDDPERAVHAGLELIDAVGRLAPRAGSALQVRVGIATGLVMVGDLLDEGGAREEAIVGETPNLAARLQALAAPGTVAISPLTRRLVAGSFECADLGPQRLRGLPQPVRVWRVLGASGAESRFEARRMEGLTPLVGREEELALLLRRWELAKGGEGQVVLLAGEPGIGKSRLVRALRERLDEEAHTPLRHQGSPYHTNSALHPVVERLERAAGFERDDTAETKLAKLEALLAVGTEDVGAVAPLVADLLSVPVGGRYPPLDLTPQQRKARLFGAFLAQLEGLAAKQPVLVVFEDAHWFDPTTAELVGVLADRVRALPVLLLVTYRPEFTPGWAHHAHATLLTLNRLGRRQVAAMVKRITGGKPLPDAVLEQITARTDGMPLFVEELTKAVLESGLVNDEGDRYGLEGSLPPLAIPPTLRDSLTARLDRLAPVKEVAQIGAVIGREFEYELLAVVAPLGEAGLRQAMDQLVEAELVFRRGAPPDATYSFKHALVQDAAYGSLLRSRRRQIHARVAAALEEHFPDRAEAQPELLAHHWMEAGLAEKAIEYRRKAGQRAMARSAMAEAVAQLTLALELLAGLPAGPDRDRKELDLRVTLGGALVAAKGLGAPEVGKAYARARELCAGEADAPELLAVLSGLFGHHQHASGVHAALEIAAELLRSGERQRDTAGQAMGHRCLGAASLFGGRLSAALAHFEQALTLYGTADRASPVFLWASDTRVACLSFTSSILLWQGYPDQAVARSRAALAAAEELGHAHTTSHALYLSCWFHQVRGDVGTVRERASAAMSLAAEHGFPLWASSATVLHGWVLAAEGEVAAGVARMRQGLAAHGPVGMQLQRPYFLGLLADVLTRAGDCAEALDLLAQALAIVERSEERCMEAELHRLNGEVLLALSPVRWAEAEACYHRALAAARGQAARLWELRAAVGLARLWRGQGRLGEGHDLLAPVYGWFTEGFDTPDLKDAKALLDKLASAPLGSRARPRHHSAAPVNNPGVRRETGGR
jgi:predicted ATPase/class 3 adenylate cyclase